MTAPPTTPKFHEPRSFRGDLPNQDPALLAVSVAQDKQNAKVARAAAAAKAAHSPGSSPASPTAGASKLGRAKPAVSAHTALSPTPSNATSRKNGLISGKTQTKSSFTFPHQSTVFWNGRHWKFKLDVPVAKMPTTQQEQQELNEAIEKARDVFLADLERRGSNLGTADFEFEFTDTGYQAYVPTHSGVVDEFVEATDKPAQTLSTIIQSCNPKKLGKYISGQIDTNQELSTLYMSSQKKAERFKIGHLNPVGFINGNGKNLCYLNTAVQQWATNPVIRGELLKPRVIRGGEGNPLYKVLKAYDDAQRAGHPAPLDLTALRQHLSLQPNVQLDEQEALQRLHQEIDFDKASSNSPIVSRSKSFHSTAAEPDKWTLHTTTSSTGSPVDTLNPEMAKREIAPTQGQSVETALVAQQTRNLDGGHKTFAHGKEKYEFTKPPAVFTVHVKRTTHDQKKDGTPMDACNAHGKMKLDGALYGKPGEKTTYDLVSFSHHIGPTPAGGHYVTYVRAGDKFLLLDDAKPAQEVSANTFYHLAKTAYVLIYNEEVLHAPATAATASPAATGATASAAATAASSVDGELTHILRNKIYKDTRVVAGVGDILTRPNATLVNFTDNTLYKPTHIYKAAQVHAELIGKRKAQANKGLFKDKKGLFKVGEAVYTSSGKLDEQAGIIHTVVPNLSLTTTLSDKDKKDLRKAVRAALTEAQKQEKTHVAFSFLDTASPWDVYNEMQLEIADFAEKHKDDITPLEKIEIVLSAPQRDQIVLDQNQRDAAALLQAAAKQYAPPQRQSVLAFWNTRAF